MVITLHFRVGAFAAIHEFQTDFFTLLEICTRHQNIPMSDEHNESDEVLSNQQEKKMNTGFHVATPFLLQTGANSALKAMAHFAQVMNYQVFTEAKSGGVNLNSEGSVHPVQGSLQWNSPSQSHIKGLPEISMGLDRGWETHDGNHSLSCAHGGGEERH